MFEDSVDTFWLLLAGLAGVFCNTGFSNRDVFEPMVMRSNLHTSRRLLGQSALYMRVLRGSVRIVETVQFVATPGFVHS